MKQPNRWWFAARRETIDAMSAADVMDMLRYDAARVECNPPEGLYLMSKAEAGGYPQPEARRWESFGVRVYILGKSPLAPSREEIMRVVEASDRMRGGVR